MDNKNQEHLFAQVREALGAQDLKALEAALPPNCLTTFILRSLASTQQNVVETAKQLRAITRWRQQQKAPFLERPANWEILTKLISHGLHGHDKLGRPVMYTRSGIGHTHEVVKFSTEAFIQCHLYRLDAAAAATARAYAKYPLTAHQMVIVFDALGASPRMRQMQKFNKHIMHVEQTYYPELVAKVLIVNAPKIMRVLGKLMMNATMAAKTVFVPPEHTVAELTKLIDVDQLPVEYGGQCGAHGACGRFANGSAAYPFDHTQNKEKEKEEEEKKQKRLEDAAAANNKKQEGGKDDAWLAALVSAHVCIPKYSEAAAAEAMKQYQEVMQFEELTLAAGTRRTVELACAGPRSICNYHWSCGKDIVFGAVFHSKDSDHKDGLAPPAAAGKSVTVVEPHKYSESSVEAVQDTYISPSAGTLVLEWRNGGLFTSKTVKYVTTVGEPDNDLVELSVSE